MNNPHTIIKRITGPLQRVLLFFTVMVLALVSVVNYQPHKASALAGSSFNPGFIISDATFYNSVTMNQNDIQSWLNAQLPNCDTNGTQLTTHANGSGGYYTRAQWGALNNSPAPYTCLKDYSLTNGTVAADSYCSAIPAGSRTSAQVIATVAQACGINPQVLLVLLQKEQGLVTDDWPWASQYQAATGFGCPDTAACDSQYYGLFNQLYWGAHQYQYYKANPTRFNFQAGRSQNIPYNPSSSCGGSQVYIQNQATAGLYDYTPYQPNAAALNNLNGTGDSCSAYGNRNFWRTFNNWFGDPTAGCSSLGSNKVLRLYDPKTFQHYYTTDYCEANTLTQKYGYSFEGGVYSTVAAGTPNAQPIYRLYNDHTGIHYYATNQSDINAAVSGAGYHLEGIAYYVASPSTPGAFPVYQLYNPRTFIHMWVTSQADINAAVSGAGYTYEGPVYYATQ